MAQIKVECAPDDIAGTAEGLWHSILMRSWRFCQLLWEKTELATCFHCVGKSSNMRHCKTRPLLPLKSQLPRPNTRELTPSFWHHQNRNSAQLHCFIYIEMLRNASHVTGVKTAIQVLMKLSPFQSFCHEHQQTEDWQATWLQLRCHLSPNF